MCEGKWKIVGTLLVKERAPLPNNINVLERTKIWSWVSPRRIERPTVLARPAAIYWTGDNASNRLQPRKQEEYVNWMNAGRYMRAFLRYRPRAV
jgi:hypothetical protein